MRFELPEDKKLVFEMSIPIRWGDMDALSHVNNTIYFRYFETARLEWFRSFGALPGTAGVGPLIVNAFCTFHRQLEYPGDALVRHFTGEIGRSSFDTFVTIGLATEPEAVYASGGATVVWTDFAKQKSVPMPDWVRERLLA